MGNAKAERGRRSRSLRQPAAAAKKGPQKQCFVVEPLGDRGSEVRNHSDLVFNFVMYPPLSQAGYTPVRPLDLKDPGMMTEDIFRHIVNSDLIVANLSGQNPNVFYEVAIRHVTKRPIIHIIRKGEALPFDIGNMRAVFVDVSDFESVRCAREEVASQIAVIESRQQELRSPVSMYFDLQQLTRSKVPENQIIADLVKEMADRTKALANLEFDEKLAVMAAYKQRALNEELFDSIEIVRNDFRAVSHLRDWVDRGMRERLIRDYILVIVEAAEKDMRLMDNSDKRSALREIISLALGYNIELDRLAQFAKECDDAPMVG